MAIGGRSDERVEASSDPLSLDPLTRLLGALGPEVTAEEVQAVRRGERDRLLAKAAGMFCIAVPTDVGATLDSHADAAVDGLDSIDLRHLPSTPGR